MKLKQIEIIGFKSFADKIKLEFHHGLTAIVGPNGCGKSNVSDAFRWVFGEQSAKSMRGGKMVDVIFAGSATRKPLNFAEVTITLTEVNETLNVEYEEIAITRRLHRTGESDYFLNRLPIRLKDLHSLFLDSGIGKDAYSFFEQGEMDQIINNTPLERRYIFEEAAGILRFLQRKREALHKLEQADFNIIRVKDIHNEVEKRIKVLKEQAEKARTFKENKIKIEELEKAVILTKWQNLQRKKGDFQKRKVEQSDFKQSFIQQLEQCKMEGAEAKKSLGEKENIFRSKSEEVFKARGEKELKWRDKQSNQERIKETLAKEKRWLHELNGMHEKRKQRQNEQEITQKQQKTLENELSIQEGSLKDLREKMHQLECEVGHLRDQQQLIQKEHMEFLQNENQIASELKQTNIRLEASQEKGYLFSEKKEKLFSQKKQVSIQLKEKEEKFHELSSFIDEQKKHYLEKDQILIELVNSLQKLQDQLGKGQKELTELKARQKVLTRLKEDLEGFSEGSKKLIQESNHIKSPIYQKIKGLYEYVVPEKNQALSISTVMKPYAHTLVTQTSEDLQTVLQFAQKNGIKEFSLISLEDVYKKDLLPPISHNPLITNNDPIMNHFFKRIALAKNYNEGINLSNQNPDFSFWLEDGTYLDHHQVLFFTTQGENNVFMREAELKEMVFKLKQLEASIGQLNDHLHIIQDKKTEVYNERLELDKVIRKNEMTLVEVNFSLQRLNGDLEKIDKEESHLAKELETVSAVILKLSETVEMVEAKLTEAKIKAGEVIAKSAALNQILEKKTKILKIEQRNLQEKEAAFHKITDENRKALHSLHVIEVKDLESQQQENRLEQEINQCRKILEDFNLKEGQYDHLMIEAEKLLNEVNKACAESEKQMILQKKHLELLENKINEQQSQLKKIENDEYQLILNLTQIEANLETLQTELQERYQMTFAQLLEMGIHLEKSLDQTERQIRLLKNEIEAAGNVNMLSIDEFEQHQARYLFLNRELDDMNISKQELIQIIASLDDESRRQFKITFEKIKTNFKKNFGILFNGGEADLEFTDTSDVLEAGIEIIAKPPGKQMRSINLLSGGEKCLTAMALLFAIFEVKPSPFCILDEIDAPLDDTNVERFINVLKQFINRCQFIVITHNKRTMGAADVLFGISMEEKGVSKVLSMEFSQQQSPVGSEVT